MKKCPTCEKTFDDSLKFCQVDGTPLVEEAKEEEPLDPYKTMVATPKDILLTPEKTEETPAEASNDPVEISEPEEIKEPEKVSEPEKPEESFDPYKTVVAGGPTQIGNQDVSSSDDGSDDDQDLMKTMVVSGDTSDDIEVEIPKGKSAEEEEEEKEEPDDTPPPSPFSDPIESKKEESSPDQTEVSADNVPGDKPSAPIPSPFDHSMPPGYAPPSTPPFDPTEPVKAEKVGAAPPVKEPEAESPEEEWTPPEAPIEEWKDKEIGENTPFESTPATEGQDQTLAYVSLACGILSMLCCFGIITGPAGLITGFIARSKISENPNEYGGGTLALIGMITGGIGTLLFFALIILQIAFGALSGF